MPARGMGSADGRRVLAIGDYGVSESWFHCFDIASGKELWSYPDNFVGVHGSHQACPPEAGMIRGSFGPCGVAQARRCRSAASGSFPPTSANGTSSPTTAST